MSEKIDMVTWAESIAEHLPGWRAEPWHGSQPDDQWWRAALVPVADDPEWEGKIMPPGFRLFIYKSLSDTKVEIRPEAPKYRNGQGRLESVYVRSDDPAPSVGVNVLRAPKGAAADIARRLLTDAYSWYIRQSFRAEESQAYVDRKAAMVADLVDAGLVRTSPHMDSDRVFFSGGEGQVHSDSITLTLRSLPPEKARAVLELVGVEA